MTSSLEMTFNVNVNQVSNDNYQSLISEGTKIKKEKKVKMGTLVVSSKKKKKETKRKEIIIVLKRIQSFGLEPYIVSF